RLSRSTRNASESESAVSACCAASGAVSTTSGSGSPGPTKPARPPRPGRSRPDVARGPAARRARLVDREPRRDGREVGLRRLDLLAVAEGAVEAQEGVLHHVLRLGAAAEHAVGDREDERPQLPVELA